MKKPTGNDWVSTKTRLPIEKKAVVTRNADGWSGYSEETILRRKGEFWFYPDWSIRTYYIPMEWKYLEI